jgi:hypothetical protein
MIRNSAHCNQNVHNSSLKLLKAILSTDRNRQQATGNRQQATGNRQQATGNRQLYSPSKQPCQLSNSIYFLSSWYLFSISLFLFSLFLDIGRHRTVRKGSRRFLLHIR